jgi:sigma-B regulation protein RsbU (phosphoserine phosphatase)
MLLNIVPGHEVPIYRQIEQQTAAAISARQLHPGDRLLPYQELAERLVISPLAAKKAYQGLISEGLCQPDGGNGAVRVAPAANQVYLSEQQAELLESMLDLRLSLKELELARDIQCRLLPPAAIEDRGFAVAAQNHPARYVAGDFYDVIRHADGSIGVVVADVAGKGIGTALIMASVKAVMPFIATNRSVEQIFQVLNQKLCSELGPREFVALAYARLDPAAGRMTVANAGLPDPYLLPAGAAPVEVKVPWPRLPLGVRRDIEYQAVEVTMQPGDRLLLFSDGIPEAPTAGDEPFGYNAFARIVAAAHAATGSRDHGAAALERWLQSLLEQVRHAIDPAATAEPGLNLEDDWTALVIESCNEE